MSLDTILDSVTYLAEIERSAVNGACRVVSGPNRSPVRDDDGQQARENADEADSAFVVGEGLLGFGRDVQQVRLNSEDGPGKQVVRESPHQQDDTDGEFQGDAHWSVISQRGTINRLLRRLYDYIDC